MSDVENKVIKIITKNDRIKFEKVEKKLKHKWTRGEIRNAIWKLAYEKQIVILSDYSLKVC